MIRRPASVWRDAVALLGARLVLAQAALLALVAALTVLWLHLPDASAVDVSGSVLLGLVVVGTAGAGETSLFLRLCGTPRTKRRLLLGTVLLLAGAGLWLWVCSAIGHLERTDYLRAGYLNSQVSFRWRGFFSFAHIMLWLGWIWTAVRWVVAGAIAGFMFPVISSVRPVRAIGQVFRSATYWVVLVVGAVASSTMTGLLVSWTPGHGLRIETISLVMRLGAAFLVDCTVAVLVLALLAVCSRRSDTAQDTSLGTPETSQPRTIDNP